MPTPHEDKLLRRIRQDELTAIELQSLYRNAEKRENELIMQECILAIRQKHRALATQMFGPREAGARAKLEEVLAEISGPHQIDLRTNKRGSHVMIGGGMFDGSCHVDVYIAYRSASGAGISLGIVQDTPDSEAYPRIGRSNLRHAGGRAFENFTMDRFRDAAQIYVAELKILAS